MENLAEFYYEKLKSTTNPSQLIAQFYSELTGKISGRAEVIMFGKLIKVFGRFTVFFSTMDLANYEIEGSAYALLYRICKSRFEREFETSTSASSTDLSRTLNALEKEMERVRKHKIKIPDSKTLGEVDDRKSV